LYFNWYAASDPFLTQFEEVDAKQGDVTLQLQEKLKQEKGKVTTLKEVCTFYALSVTQHQHVIATLTDDSIIQESLHRET